MFSRIPSAISRPFFLKHLTDSPTLRWLILLGATGTCVLIGIGCYLRYRRRVNPRGLRANQLMRSGVWKSLNFAASPGPVTPGAQVADLSSDQLFDNGVISFNQAVNSWRACCDVLEDEDTELDSALEDLDSVSTATSLPTRRISERRVRALLLQADYLSQSIDRVFIRWRSVANGSVGDTFKLDSSCSDALDSDYKGLPTLPFPFQDNLSNTSEDTNNNNKRLQEISDTESFQSATLQSDTDSLSGLSPSGQLRHSNVPRIIFTTNVLYREALALAKSSGIFVRHMRTGMLNCGSDFDFMAKLHCVRSAFDLLVLSDENCLFFESKTTEMMTRFLSSANKDPEAFAREFKDMINFVKTPQNSATIKKELNARNLKVVGFWDVAIDFALLDAFTDLENLPTPVTMVTQNRWLTPGLRESALTNAVWAVMQGKIKMLENKTGFMSHFYKLGETFMFTLAWGFLGTDEELKETCGVLKEGILAYLRDVFDLRIANYSSLETLSEDILAITRDKVSSLNSRL